MIDLVLLQPPDTVSANPTMYFPLSLAYLAAVVKKAGFSVKVLDFRKAVGELPEARYYGFSCTTPQIRAAKQIAGIVKGKTIVGGAHASLLPEDCIGYFDHIVIGEGEEIIIPILEGKYPAKTIHNMPRVRTLSDVPFPAWDMVEHPFSDTLFPGERYGKGEKAATIIASRGCPFQCDFCGNMLRTPVVYRSVENIVEELMILRDDYGVKYFRFEDDNFTLHPQFDILCMKIAMLDIHYKCHTHPSLLTETMAMFMKHSGCEECGLGLETADDRILSAMHKSHKAVQAGKAVEILKAYKLRAKTYLMAGLPGETDESIEITKEFFRKYKPDKWTLSTFSPYPGCDIFKKPEDYGIKIIEPDFSKWWNFSNHFNHVLEGQTEEQMWQRYQNFYEWLKKEEWKNAQH